jgi:hypothetical protein
MQFIFSIGGYTGDSYCLELKDGILQCETSGYGFEPMPDQTKLIPVQDNLAFKEMLDYLATMRWKEKYEKVGVLDGTNWELKVATDSFSIDTYGSNAYPPHFAQFLKLLNKITRPEGIHVS